MKLQYHYRPQTKFAKVMFLHLSVSHSVHRGGVCLSACWDTPPGTRHPPDQATPPTRHPPSGSRDGYCCGRYASYWNALLFKHKLNYFSVLFSNYTISFKPEIVWEAILAADGDHPGHECQSGMVAL